MPVQVRQLAREVVANLGLDAGQELAAQWISQRYRELCSRAKFRHLRRYDQLYLAAPIQTGTCTVTIDSSTVTLDPTALAACRADQFLDWPDGFQGLFFRPQSGSVWYRIIDASDELSTITLETPFAQDNNWLVTGGTTQSGLTFFITPRYLELNPKARQLGVFIADFMYRPMENKSMDELNRWWSNRPWVWSYPQWWAELTNDSGTTGQPKMVEIAPWPLQSTTVHYTYWEMPEGLDFGDYVPPTIDPDILREGAMADAANNMVGRELRKGNIEAAAMWRNIFNQHRTAFEQKVPRAIRNDRGADDLAFALKNFGWRPPLDWDPITTAWDQFIARGY